MCVCSSHVTLNGRGCVARDAVPAGAPVAISACILVTSCLASGCGRCLSECRLGTGGLLIEFAKIRDTLVDTLARQLLGLTVAALSDEHTHARARDPMAHAPVGVATQQRWLLSTPRKT